MDIQAISAIGGLTVGLAGVLSSVWTNQKLVKQKNKEDERKEVYKKLNDFYGPLVLLRNKSQILYGIYSSQKNDNRSTLELLLEGKKLDSNEKVLLSEIVELGKTCENMMIKNAGLVDNETLRQDVLPKAISHFYILREVFNQNIKKDKIKFEEYCFPIELDDLLEREIVLLKKRLEQINK